MTVLCSGKYEGLKAGVHAVALGTVAVCAAYNLAAWVTRRERHLAINAVLYSAAAIWEYQHVLHHLTCQTPRLESNDAAQPLEKVA
jgi:hypothetical protein